MCERVRVSILGIQRCEFQLHIKLDAQFNILLEWILCVRSVSTSEIVLAARRLALFATTRKYTMQMMRMQSNKCSHLTNRAIRKLELVGPCDSLAAPKSSSQLCRYWKWQDTLVLCEFTGDGALRYCRAGQTYILLQPTHEVQNRLGEWEKEYDDFVAFAKCNLFIEMSEVREDLVILHLLLHKMELCLRFVTHTFPPATDKQANICWENAICSV